MRLALQLRESHDRLADQADMTVLGVRHVLPEGWRRVACQQLKFDADSCNTCAESLAKISDP
jgi:hypothetical protein